MNRHPLRWCWLGACVLGLLLAGSAAAFPRPAAVSNSWNLDFSFHKPRAISYPDLHGHMHWYWYMPYTVVNNTGSDQLLVPDFVIADNLGQIIHAGQNVPVGLFDRIKKRLGNPLLQSPMDVVGTIKQGEDFAKQSVAIWPAPQKDLESMTVFVGGLSGETATTTDPATGKKVLLRKTLMIRFALPGVYKTPQHQPVQVKGKSQVMR